MKNQKKFEIANAFKFKPTPTDHKRNAAIRAAIEFVKDNLNMDYCDKIEFFDECFEIGLRIYFKEYLWITGASDEMQEINLVYVIDLTKALDTQVEKIKDERKIFKGYQDECRKYVKGEE